MEAYSTNCELYNQSSKSFYQEYAMLLEEIKNINNRKSTWNYDSHSEEDNQKYDSYTPVIRRDSIATIVFQSLAIESYLNLYGAYYLGDKYYKEYEYQSPCKKLCQLCKDVTKKDFPIDDLYKDIDLLFKKRNSLVHHKAYPIDIKTSSPDEFINFINKNVYDPVSNIKKDIFLYDRLKNKLKELEGAEFDIIEQLNREMYQELCSNVIDMYKLK